MDRVVVDDPVYNVTVQESDEKAGYATNRNKSLDVVFFIGEDSESNILESGDSQLSDSTRLELDGTPSVKHLTVEFNCYGCRSDAYAVQQTAEVRYYPELGRSENARFRLNRNIHEEQAILVFSLSVDGRPLDNVVANLRGLPGTDGMNSISASDTPKLRNRSARSAAGAAFLSQVPHDVQIFLGPRDSDPGSGLAISVEIRDEGLLQLLGSIHCETAQDGECREFKSFPTNFGNAREVQDISASHYANLLNYLAKPNERFINTVRTLKSSSKISNAAQDLRGLSKEERRQLYETLSNVGFDFAHHLFIDSSDSRQIFEAIDTYRKPGSSPLVVRISSNGIFLPWHLLNLGNREIWGAKFLITVDPFRAHPISDTKLEPLDPTRIRALFLRYQSVDDSRRDDFSFVAKEHLNELIAKGPGGIGGQIPFSDVHSATGLKETLQSERAEIGALLSYVHGWSGITAIDGNVAAASPYGNQIVLSETERISASSLIDIARPFLMAGGRENEFFSQRPIVILNGCETGTNGIIQVRWTNSLLGAFVRLGARGVLATDAPIPASYGYVFQQELWEELLYGGTVPSFLLEKRRSGDILSLLYSYYGNLEPSIGTGR